MKITYYRGKYPNFGDELNIWLWPKIIPDFFDNDDKQLFIGIGSVIGEKYDDKSKKIVFGAGYVPEYHEKPDVHGSDWDIYFVRGPRSARLLDISPDLGIGDAAILVRNIIDLKTKTAEVISFVPHWESLETGNWEEVCRLANVNLIDPRRPVDEVIRELLRSQLVIAEAMHAAIVSDALRIPWIPMLPIDALHRSKWFDWAESLKINLHHYRLWPSSLAELELATKRRPVFMNVANSLISCGLSNIMDKGLKYMAAQRLMQLSKQPPCRSEDEEMLRVTEIMQTKLDQFQHDYRKK